MKPGRLIILLSSFFLLSLYIPEMVFSAEAGAAKNEASDRQVKLSWEEVDDAVRYRINLKNDKGQTIIDREIETNKIIVDLAPGNYKLRIGVINKFEKLGAWSDWTNVNIEAPKPVVVEKEPPEKKDILSLGLKLGAGISYFRIMSPWNDYFKDSFGVISVNAAYSFNYVNFPSFLSFFRYSGFDLDSSYVKFSGYKEFNKVDSDLTSVLTSLNFFISTNFSFPLNVAIRGGSGVSLSTMDYVKYNTAGTNSEKGQQSSVDLFFKAGVSIEYRLYSGLFFEGAADYYSIQYQPQNFNCYRFTFRFGIRL